MFMRREHGGKDVGIDNIKIEMIEKIPRKYLYPVWNRLASGKFSSGFTRSIYTKGQRERMLAWNTHDVRPGSPGGDPGGTGTRTGAALSPKFIRIPAR